MKTISCSKAPFAFQTKDYSVEGYYCSEKPSIAVTEERASLVKVTSASNKTEKRFLCMDLGVINLGEVSDNRFYIHGEHPRFVSFSE